MIDAAVIGLGRWGKNIVEAAQGKSKRLHFIRGVSKEPELVAILPAPKASNYRPSSRRRWPTRACRLFSSQRRIRCMSGRFPRWRRPASRSGAKSRWLLRARRPSAPLPPRKKPACLSRSATTSAAFPCMRELKRVVADGTIGEILHIEGNFTNEHSTRVKGGWRDDPRESPGGGMTGAGLHVLDAFVNLAGPIAQSRCARPFAKAAARPARRRGGAGSVRERRHRPARDRARCADVLADHGVRHQRLGRSARGNVADRRQSSASKPETTIYPPVGFARRAAGSLRRDHRNRQAVSGLDRRYAGCRRRIRGGHPLDRRRQASRQ